MESNFLNILRLEHPQDLKKFNFNPKQENFNYLNLFPAASIDDQVIIKLADLLNMTVENVVFNIYFSPSNLKTLGLFFGWDFINTTGLHGNKYILSAGNNKYMSLRLDNIRHTRPIFEGQMKATVFERVGLDMEIDRVKEYISCNNRESNAIYLQTSINSLYIFKGEYVDFMHENQIVYVKTLLKSGKSVYTPYDPTVKYDSSVLKRTLAIKKFTGEYVEIPNSSVPSRLKLND